MSDNSLQKLRKEIDDALLTLDARLCARARKEQLPRKRIHVVDLGGKELEALVRALARDTRLCGEFQRAATQPIEMIFDDVYAEATAPAQEKPAPRPHAGPRGDDSDYRNATAWARRVNSLAGEALIDALTLQGIAYVLAVQSALRKEFHATVAECRNSHGTPS